MGQFAILFDDLVRFSSPRQLMAYLGLVPSEHSSGASIRRGGLIKAGNSARRDGC
jgi:transposase